MENKKIEIATVINASKEKIWQVLLSDETYRQWTTAFDAGSYAEGDWSEGSRMLFKNGEGSGLISNVIVHKPFEIITLEHVGVLKNGVEDKDNAEMKDWMGFKETYRLSPTDNNCKLSIEQDMGADYYDWFLKAWKAALQKIKELSEANN